MRFFEPADAWLDWCATYARGRIVFDVGAGEGHVTKALHERGVRAVGIEPRHHQLNAAGRDVALASAIMPVEAEHSPLLASTENALVLFCRPCHSGFVMRTVNRLHETSVPVYVGLTMNLTADIDLRNYRLARLPAPAGPEGEQTWRLARRVPVGRFYRKNL